MTKVIVITGAGSGFGALSARRLALAGYTVYAGIRETTGRNAHRVQDAATFAEEHGADLRTIELDISSQESCDVGIEHVIAEAGRLDVVVHNAGHMVLGPLEAFTPEDLSHVYDVNVLGTQRGTERRSRPGWPHSSQRGRCRR
jgi:NAD(P)-dependent dehydrogenase (short-subunit alcohol dehydrogenase family)